MTRGWFRTIEVDGWVDFKSLVARMLDDEFGIGPLADYWFRGQGDSTYPLVSSLDRRHSALSIPDRLDLQEAIRSSFVGRAVSVSPALRNDPDWCLGMLQHHGAPTRLLDWTTSPYVAGYFALTSPPASIDDGSDLVSVWLLNTSAEHWRSRAGLRMIKPAFDDNRRAFQQHGYFTINESLSQSIESYLASYYVDGAQADTPALVRIDFPRSESSLGLRDLALMGITSESLFPEFEGLARHAYFQALDFRGLLD